ncbi:tyrosine-protein phosphatase [Sediminicola luteus]|uniref:protein-tyrosine-phosphatase n=1 Tax=Sediminicola luteus TaxID=319238 RepID=A0A2A4G4E6_9FLAO|nr:CpsB/CapC family capsule biosynthesis tyrosine phosphatase [Sediminicola luteus]PCE62622.1 histidinol phosphatase [Sediminicola luteus]
MFSFFEKKRYLADQLKGLVDIHNHILPGIDDGAKNADESLALIKGLGEFGIERFIATPHIMNHYFENTNDSIVAAYEHLKPTISVMENTPKISLAAEHMIDDNFEHLLEQDAIMPMGKEHLLVEMSYLQPPINFDQAIAKVQQKGLFPILAHPERYNFLHGHYHKYVKMKQDGIRFQLNLLSIGGYYGKGVQKTAFKLIEDGYIDFVGTDTHHMGHVEGLKKVTLPEKQITEINKLVNKTIELFY